MPPGPWWEAGRQEAPVLLLRAGTRPPGCKHPRFWLIFPRLPQEMAPSFGLAQRDSAASGRARPEDTGDIFSEFMKLCGTTKGCR